MTKEQELAKEAGFDLDGMPNMLYTVRGNHAQLERLIKLVRNAALEDAAQVCESRQTPGTGSVAILTGAADAIRNLKEPTP